MTKFKVGDEVVCVDKNHSKLEYLKQYIIRAERGVCVFWEDVQVEYNGYFYPKECFELFSEWSAHQKPVSTETELSLTKLQVKMLQDWKKDALYLLSKTSHEDMIPTTLREEIDYFLVNNKLEGFDE